MTIVAGSTPVNMDAVNASINAALQMPTETPAKVAPPAQTPPAAPPAAPPVQNTAPPAPPVPPVQQVNGVEIPSFDDAPPADAPPVETPPPAPVDDDSDLPDTPAAENFKKLREVVKETRKAKAELEEKHKEAAAKLERYEKGEIVPDVMRAKDERIQQLEQYEKVVNIKLSPEYQESFIKPAIALREELETLGKDYGIEPEVMQQLVEVENKKDLNSWLSRHFDEVGAQDVKKVISRLHELGDKALEAEKEPQAVLQTLRAQFAEKEQQEQVQRATVFETTAKSAWGKALEKTAKEGAYRELILHPTDKKFNSEVVEPVQYRASIQFGALIKKLAQNGLKEMPDDLAEGLARMVLLSIGGAMNLNAKSSAEKRASEVIENTRRTQPLIRPSIGGQNGSGGNSQPVSRGPTNPKEAGNQVKF